MSTLSKEQLRAIVYYEFLQGHSVAEATANIHAAFKEDVLSRWTVNRFFNRFQSGDISFEDQPRSGRPSVLNDDDIREALKCNPDASTRELSMKLACCQTTIVRHLEALGYRKVVSTWVPHELHPFQLAARVSVSQSLLLRPHRKDLNRQLVTGDESWVLYVNHTRKKSWLPRGEPPPKEPKPNLHEKKVLLCCWWDMKGMLYWELLPSGHTVTAQVYASQLQKLAEKIGEKRGKRVQTTLLHDNARPHVAKLTQAKIDELGWEVLPHPPHSPDLAPSDYHLFRALKAHLREKRFNDQSELQTDIAQFFDAQPPEFWAAGIESLVDRWTYVVDHDGEYVVD